MYNQLARLRKDTALKKSQIKNGFCFLNFKKYLKETTLHGLRFVGDETISIWERAFFFFAIIAGVIITVELVSYIYAKWVSTPIIIGVNPYPTFISDIPFPAITICNMNQLLYSKVANYSKNSFEGAIVDIACFGNKYANFTEVPDHYKHNNLSLPDFFAKNGQSCKNMLLSCQFNSENQNCSDLFHNTLADEGLCCVFNTLHPAFLLKTESAKNAINTVGAVPVNWSPEFGYPENLPKDYYPRPASGIGVSMGLTLVLDAKYDEYFCSSANGAGFKVAINNPVESPRVRENGLIVGVGAETRYSIDAHNYVAESNIRSLHYSLRKCFFADEGNLIYFKYYTRRNCENECQSRYIFKTCDCIPFNLPLIFSNASVCGASQNFCVERAQDAWLQTEDSKCRLNCLNSCFDYTYLANAYTAPLVQGDYRVQSDYILRNMSRKYIRENILILHFFFREFVFHGNTRNIYIGFNEFLSNIGGILSLFLGFSFISLAEIFYYACMRPFFFWLKSRRNESNRINTSTAETPDVTIWLSDELLHIRREPVWVEPSVWNRWSHRKLKNDQLKNQMKRFYSTNAIVKPLKL